MSLQVLDANGATKNLPMFDRAYSVAAYAVAAVTSATDVVQLVGATGTVARIKRIEVSAVPGIATAASQQISLFRRSTAGSGGTVGAMATVAKHDTTSSAAGITVNQITATAATAGTAAGTIRTASLHFPAATGISQPVVWDFTTRQDEPIVLRAGEYICLGFAGVTPGNTFNFSIEWEEGSL